MQNKKLTSSKIPDLECGHADKLNKAAFYELIKIAKPGYQIVVKLVVKSLHKNVAIKYCQKGASKTSTNYHHKNNCPGLHIWCFAILHNKLSKTETRECWWEKGQEKVTQIVVEASHSTPPIACLLFTNSFSLSLGVQKNVALQCSALKLVYRNTHLLWNQNFRPVWPILTNIVHCGRQTYALRDLCAVYMKHCQRHNGPKGLSL